MPLVDLGDFLDDDALKLKLTSPKFPDGKEYAIASPDAETGLWLTGLANLGGKVARAQKNGTTVPEEDLQALQFDGAKEKDLMQIILGDTLTEMVEDGIAWVKIQRINQYAFAYFAMSPAAAAKGVESGAFLGKAPQPNRAARRSAEKSPKSPASAGSKKKTKKTA